MLVALGGDVPATTSPRALGVFDVFVNASHRLPPGVKTQVATPGQPNYFGPYSEVVSGSVTDLLNRWGYATYTIYSLARDEAYGDFSSPVIKPYMLNLTTLKGSFDVYADALLAFAHGVGPDAPRHRQRMALHLLRGGRCWSLESATPSCRTIRSTAQPLPIARPRTRSCTATSAITRIRLFWPIRMGNTGSNSIPTTFRSGGGSMPVESSYSPLAAGYDRDGFINYIKDEGDDGQMLFKSLNLDIGNKNARENTTIVTFRADPVVPARPDESADDEGLHQCRLRHPGRPDRRFPASLHFRTGNFHHLP